MQAPPARATTTATVPTHPETGGPATLLPGLFLLAAAFLGPACRQVMSPAARR